MGVGEAAATALSLVFHELATNSMKYGALSEDTGILDLSGATEDGEVTLTWTERGGPAVGAPKSEGGYGSKLLNRSVSGQLGGTIEYDWSEKGVVIVLKLSGEKLAK